MKYDHTYPNDNNRGLVSVSCHISAVRWHM